MEYYLVIKIENGKCLLNSGLTWRTFRYLDDHVENLIFREALSADYLTNDFLYLHGWRWTSRNTSNELQFYNYHYIGKWQVLHFSFGHFILTSSLWGRVHYYHPSCTDEETRAEKILLKITKKIRGTDKTWILRYVRPISPS